MTWGGALEFSEYIEKFSHCNFSFFIEMDHFKSLLLNLLQYRLYFMFQFFGWEACGLLAPPPGTEPTPSALEGKILPIGPLGKSQAFLIVLRTFCFESWLTFISLWSHLGSLNSRLTFY